MKTILSTPKLLTTAVLVSLSVISAPALASNTSISVSALGKQLNTDITFEDGSASAGFTGDSGFGVGVAARWAFGDRFYVHAEFQAYHADIDVFLSATNEKLIAVQNTSSQTFDIGVGYALPISPNSTLEAEVFTHKRTTQLDSLQLNLNTANGSIGYNGQDLDDLGLGWRLRLESQVSDHLSLYVSTSGNESGTLEIRSDGPALSEDTLFGIGARYRVKENWLLGVSWEDGEEDTAAFSIGYHF